MLDFFERSLYPKISMYRAGREERCLRYHFAVCDDHHADALTVKALVESWAVRYGYQARVDVFPSAEAFLFRYAEDKSYDILLLDIEMTGADGISLAKTIRVENDAVQIVFITGYSDYIAEGYEVAALHYLLKPVSDVKLFEVLTRAAACLKKEERVLFLKIGGESFRLPLREIHYFEVQGNYVTIHAAKEYTLKSTLSGFENVLDERFFRIGRSFIVNLAYIRRVTRKQVDLLSGEWIPLPRGMYDVLNRAIMESVL